MSQVFIGLAVGLALVGFGAGLGILYAQWRCKSAVVIVEHNLKKPTNGRTDGPSDEDRHNQVPK